MHIPVLLKETIEILDIKPKGIYVDATVGLGGHSEAILSMLDEDGRLIGIDRDENALRYARERLGNKRVCLKKGRFSEIEGLIGSLNIKKIDGILFDLGVSMLQLRDMQRGFSFMSEERIDMRMDSSQKLSAWDVINNYPEAELERIIRDYGEEPFAKKIAKAIVSNRRKATINTCLELSEIILRACGRRGRVHPATRTFQALRIEVNKELSELSNGLISAFSVLKSGGRLCVISYHSLEDRIVKNFMRDYAKNGLMKLITKKPLTPRIEEIRANPSSRSAKLRGGEKI